MRRELTIHTHLGVVLLLPISVLIKMIYWSIAKKAIMTMHGFRDQFKIKAATRKSSITFWTTVTYHSTPQHMISMTYTKRVNLIVSKMATTGTRSTTLDSALALS